MPPYYAPPAKHAPPDDTSPLGGRGLAPDTNEARFIRSSAGLPRGAYSTEQNKRAERSINSEGAGKPLVELQLTSGRADRSFFNAGFVRPPFPDTGWLQ
ncbi:hypothetical protein AAFF_G00360010 [Aldrovandia affinis]|uniref:Uncharacterized protein n=1 Tax=Aldrovandia affinis TaxID=143900 RepID=A0AAD7SI55_9TELE|nr:hypothetical protein AAFF_G00360010 [Aldrovandia affinis]